LQETVITSEPEYKVPSRPEALAERVPLLLTVHLGQVSRALALDVFHHIRHRVLRQKRNEHAHLIPRQMPLIDSALLLLSQVAEHFPEVATKLLI